MTAGAVYAGLSDMLDESYPCRLSYTPPPIWLAFARAVTFVGMIVVPWAFVVYGTWGIVRLVSP